MAMATSSSFNQHIGNLRARGNSDNEFAKATKDRLTMLQYQMPSELKAEAGQIQAKGQAVGNALSAVSDTKGTIEKGAKAYQDYKKVGQTVVSSAQGLVGKVKGVTDQAGASVNNASGALNALKDPTNLKNATTTATTTTTTPPSSSLGGARDIGGGGGELRPMAGQANTYSGAGLPDVGGIGDGRGDIRTVINAVDNGVTSRANGGIGGAIQRLMSQPVNGAGGPGDALNRSRNVLSGATRNPMSGRNQILTDMEGGNTRDMLRDAYNQISATRGMTGGVPSTATNVHTDFNDALGDMKSQMGGALDAINQHLGNISGQVQKTAGGVGELASGVADVGKDVASVGSKVVTGVTAGLETAGAVADALGPIGDIVGLGMAIFGGIEDHKVHKEDESANTSAQQAIQAPVQGNTTQSANASLDTAKEAQVGASSHY